MKPKNKFLIILGPVLFFAGVLIGIVFFAALIWPSLESDFYFGYSAGADTKLRLTCPHIMTLADNGVITAIVTNKVDRPISPEVEANISAPIPQTIRTKPTIEPGQTAALKWDINSDNVDFGHLILAQVYQFSAYATPTAMGKCGTLFLFTSALTGNEIYLFSLVGSLALIIAGIGISLLGSGSLVELGQKRFSGMVLLGGIIVVGIILGTLDQWLFGVLVLALAVLMLTIQITQRLNPS